MSWAALHRSSSRSQFAAPPTDSVGGVRFGRFTRRSPVLRGTKIAVSAYRRRFTFVSFLSVIAGLLDTALLYLVARTAVLMTSGEEHMNAGLGPFGHHRLDFEQLVAAAVVVLVAVILVNIPLSTSSATMSRLTLLRARGRLIDAYLHASWSFRSTQPEGHLQDIMMSYCHMNEAVIFMLTTVVVCVSGLVILAVTAVFIAQWVALIACAGLAVVALVLRPLTRALKRNSLRYAALNHEYASTIAQTARVSAEIATFDVGDAVTAARKHEAVGAGTALQRVRLVYKLTPMFFQYSALGLVVGIIWILHSANYADLGVIGPLILLLVRALAYRGSSRTPPSRSSSSPRTSNGSSRRSETCTRIRFRRGARTSSRSESWRSKTSTSSTSRANPCWSVSTSQSSRAMRWVLWARRVAARAPSSNCCFGCISPPEGASR